MLKPHTKLRKLVQSHFDVVVKEDEVAANLLLCYFTYQETCTKSKNHIIIAIYKRI